MFTQLFNLCNNLLDVILCSEFVLQMQGSTMKYTFIIYKTQTSKVKVLPYSHVSKHVSRNQYLCHILVLQFFMSTY